MQYNEHITLSKWSINMVMVIKENDALLILIKLISLRIIISKIIVIGKYYHVNFDTKIRKNQNV